MGLATRNWHYESSLWFRLCLALASWILCLLFNSVRADIYVHRLNSLEWYADTCEEIHVIRVTKLGSETERPSVSHVDSIKTSSVDNVVPLPRYTVGMMTKIGSEWVVFGRKKAGKMEALHFINLAEPMAISAAGELQREPEAILKVLRDRAALKTTYPPRFDPHFIETFDQQPISISSFSPRLVDYHLGWAKRDVEILFDSDNLICSVREPIGPHHRERFLKIGEAWDRQRRDNDEKTTVAAILGLVNFPDDEVRSRLQSWDVDVTTSRTYAALQVLRYWDFIREIERSNLNAVGRWKLEGEGIDKVSPTSDSFSYRFREIQRIEFELYPDQEMAMVIIDRGLGKWFARGHWTADNETLSVNIESTIGATSGTFEYGGGQPFPFPILYEAKFETNSRIAAQTRIDIRKWRNGAPKFQMEMKATWLRPLVETESDLSSLSTRRKREPSDR